MTKIGRQDINKPSYIVNSYLARLQTLTLSVSLDTLDSLIKDVAYSEFILPIKTVLYVMVEIQTSYNQVLVTLLSLLNADNSLTITSITLQC